MSKEEVWVNQVGQMVIYEEGLSYEYLTLSYMRMFENIKTAKTITSSCIELNIYKWLKDNEYEFVGYL